MIRFRQAADLGVAVDACGGSSTAAAWSVRVALVAAMCTFLMGCAGSNAATQAPAAGSPPNLSACVQRWNRASVGKGLQYASIDAFQDGRALMFRFPDGACGLAVGRAVLINALGGDYDLSQSPLGFVSSSQLAALHSEIGGQSNVTISKSTGRVLARRNAGIVALPEVKFVNYPGCARVVVPSNIFTGRYGIVSHSVGCVAVRALIWGLNEEESKTQSHPHSVLDVAEWRCVRTKPIAHFTPITYEMTTCTRGKDVVQAQNEFGHRESAPLPAG